MSATSLPTQTQATLPPRQATAQLAVSGMPPLIDSSWKGRVKYATNFFQSNGGGAYKKHTAIGMVGNLLGENFKLDPTLLQQSGGGGYGLAQWDVARQKKFAELFGHSIKDATIPADQRFKEQLLFITYELNNMMAVDPKVYASADRTIPKNKVMVHKLLERAQNKYDAVDTMVNSFELPKARITDMMKRYQHADMVEGIVDGHKPAHRTVLALAATATRVAAPTTQNGDPPLAISLYQRYPTRSMADPGLSGTHH